MNKKSTQTCSHIQNCDIQSEPTNRTCSNSCLYRFSSNVVYKTEREREREGEKERGREGGREGEGEGEESKGRKRREGGRDS